MNPLVSVCILAYNHEKFIIECLDSILSQTCDFNIEILIHDDASTDKTPDIINKYKEQYPGIVLPIFQTDNKYSKGIQINKVYNFSRASGKYIALCEGDDYWTDNFKLQRQVDFLENNPSYSMSTENGLVIHADSRKDILFNSDIKIKCDINLITLLGKRPFPTASVLFRQTILQDKFFQENLQAGDIINWTWILTKGKIHFNPVVSSVYRRGLHGVVERSQPFEWALKMKSWNEDLLKIIKDETGIKIIQTRIFNNFKFSFIRSLQTRNLNLALASLKECIKVQPVDSIFMVVLSPLYIAKDIFNQNRKQF